MKLRVLYRKQGDPLPRHIQVTADATVTSGDVARALLKGPAADAAIDEAALPTLRVTDQAGGVTVLPPDQLVVSSGVVSGAVLEVVPAATHAGHQGDPVALLRVLGGPDTGVEVALYAGSSTVGRSSECAVRLADPLVSKLHARIEIGETVEVVDANSANGVLVGGVRVPRVAVGPGDPFVLGATTLAISYTRRLDQTASASTDVEYIRSPRVLRRRRPAAIDLPQPQKIQVAQQFPILAMLAPMMMGVGMYAVTQSLLSLIFVAFSPLMMFGSWADQRMETRRQQREADLAYDNRLAEIDHQLDGIHAEQRQRLRDAHPAVTECVDQIGRLGELVWSRRPEHPEFLQVRLGEGPVRPLVDYQNAEVTAAPRYTQPRTLLLNKYAWIADAPVIADLRSVGGVGIAGTSGVAEGVARAIVLQAVTLQSPSEMAVTCLTSTAGRQRWQWLEWLPHAASPHIADRPPATLLGGRHRTPPARSPRGRGGQSQRRSGGRHASGGPGHRGCPLGRYRTPDPARGERARGRRPYSVGGCREAAHPGSLPHLPGSGRWHGPDRGHGPRGGVGRAGSGRGCGRRDSGPCFASAGAGGGCGDAHRRRIGCSP
ncbi:FHA domain-containing protein [Propioniciclava flava]